ncbi:TPA: hypothetical protein MB363_003487 [Klebsiella quasipneumoniae subsp. similipneumoniae]|nr:hypothetical protein [Klebsiella quasipneumoniae subsp. similipneumoniae]HBT4803928.1 hypothetical protein [Klebsiella quasipneumoniae subsp. similipneumoniae]
MSKSPAFATGVKKSLFSGVGDWAVFTVVIVGAFLGAKIVVSLGFLKGLLAITLGNIVLATKQGKTFILSCQPIFMYLIQCNDVDPAEFFI